MLQREFVLGVSATHLNGDRLHYSLFAHIATWCASLASKTRLLVLVLPVAVGYQIILLQTHGSCFQLTALRGCKTIDVYQFGKNITKKKQNFPFIFNMKSARYNGIHEPLETYYQLMIFTRVFSIASMRLACLTTSL